MNLFLLIVISVPSINGLSGSFRVIHPKTHQQGDFSFSLYGGYSFQDFRYWDNTVDSVNNPLNDRRHYLLSSILFSYTPFNFLEFGFRTDFEGRMLERADIPRQRDDDGYFAYRGLDILTKLGHSFFSDTLTGIELSGGISFGYYLPNLGIERKDPKFVAYGFPMYIPQSGQFWSHLLLGVKLQILSLNGMIGFHQTGRPAKENIFPILWYNFDESGVPRRDTVFKNKDEFKDFTRLPFGVNLTLSAGPYVDFILDFHGVYFIELRTNLLALTPGVRFKTPGGVIFDFAVDAKIRNIADSLIFIYSHDRNLFTYIPDWRFIFLMSNVYNLLPKKVTVTPPPPPPASPPPPPPPAPKIAKVSGKIYDAISGEPLMAQILIEGTDKPPISSDMNGFYSVELEPGTYSFYVEKEGYAWMRKSFVLKEGAELVIDFPLKKKELILLTGKIVDNVTEEPIIAKVSIPETGFEGTLSDPETGSFKLKLPPGTYILKIEAEGYISESIPVVLKEGEPLVEKNIKLKKKAQKGVTIRLQNIYFDTGKATIKPESYPILDRVAEFLKANPNAVIEIQGHTDSVGSDSYNLTLSQARAEAVRNYLINFHNIDPSKLIAKGYGETMPIADNLTREGRAMNRRVEFKVISVSE
ncbi:MAG: OmpA family protein [Candidatus Hydrothermales bacterium]